MLIAVTWVEILIGPPWIWGLAALGVVWYGSGWLAFRGWCWVCRKMGWREPE